MIWISGYFQKQEPRTINYPPRGTTKPTQDHIPVKGSELLVSSRITLWPEPINKCGDKPPRNLHHDTRQGIKVYFSLGHINLKKRASDEG